MADETMRFRVTADAAQAEGELHDLDRLADKIDLDPKIDVKGVDTAKRDMGGLADAASRLPGPLGDAAGLLSGGGGIAAGATAAAAGLVAASEAFADGAMDAKALQTAVGGTVEETSRLLAVTGDVGLDYNDLLELIAESNKAIGANADEAARLGVELTGTPIERFQQLVDAVYKIPDPLQRSAAASKFFGEEGSKQLPVLVARYESLGAAMRDVADARVFSEDDAAAAVKYQQAMAELKGTFSGLANDVARNAVPKLTQLLSIVNTVVETIGGAKNLLVSVDVQADAVRDLINDMGGLDAQSGATKQALKEMASEAGILDEFQSDAADSARTLGGSWEGLVTAASGVVTAYNEQRDAADELREAEENLRGEQMSMADAAVQLERGTKDLSDAIKEAGDDGKYTRDELEGLADQVKDNADAQVALAGVTRESDAGSQIYQKSLRDQARTMGNTLTPEMVNYMNAVEAIPDESVTAILAAINAGDWAAVDALIAGVDAATPTATAGVTPAQAEWNAVNAKIDELERRQVYVTLVPRITAALQNALNGVIPGAAATRSTQQAAARYVWRNGRYVETP